MSGIPEPWVPKDNDVSMWVSFHHLEISYLLSPQEHTGIIAPFRNMYDALLYHCGQEDRKTRFYRIKDLSGYLAPGESTLILSPPGSGRSSLLKTLSLSLPIDSGDVFFNGMTEPEAKENGVQLSRMVKYVDQIDTHFDQLTVFETIQFAHRLTSPTPSLAYLNLLLSVFNMEECRNTPASQCSGGQRRRLSTMVGLVNPATKLICFDSYSDGLDSATTERITRYLCNWAKENNANFLATLQQPAPVVMNSFTNTIVLRDGETIYNGPTIDLEQYFAGMGFPCPSDIDLPSHISHVVTNPKVFLIEKRLQDQQELQNQKKFIPLNNNKGVSSTTSNGRKLASIPTSRGDLTVTTTPILTLEEMTDYYHQSPFYHHVKNVLDHIEHLRLKNGLKPTKLMLKYQTDPSDNKTNDDNTLIVKQTPPLEQFPPLITPSTIQYYRPGYAAPIHRLLMFLMARQLKLSWRNRNMMISRLIPAVVISVFLAGLYFALAPEDYNLRLAGLMDPLIEYGYNNLVELGLFIYFRQLISAQLDLYPSWLYVTAVQIASIPFSLVETFVFAVVTYSMMGHSPDPVAIFTHYFILWIHGIALGALFRFGASLSTNTSHAYAIVAPAISITAFCGGYYIKPGSLPVYASWIYWISPFASAFRALTLNEFTSPRYDYLVPDPDDPSQMVRAGEVYLRLNDLPTDSGWILYSVLYCIGLTIILVALTSYFLKSSHEYSIGARRSQNEDVDLEDVVNNFHDQVDNQTKDDVDILKEQISIQHQHDEEYENEPRDDEFGDCDDDEGKAHNLGQNASPNTYGCTNSVDTDIEMAPVQHNTRSIDNVDLSRSRSKSMYSKSKSKSRFAAGNAKLQTLTNDLPFAPATLSFKDIKFTVQAQDNHGQSYKRVLLQNVTGYAQVGTCTALMGSSGAGKSTLLNTLMGLNKTTSTQKASGQIYVNGKILTTQQFNSIAGYVEQFETLYPYDTVFETLMFSARMRLETRDNDILTRVVNEVIDILELGSVQHRIIGSPDNPVLSGSEKKRVSIGVELVANPSILFLDEPTTGLDSESALAVCRAISSIAKSGRSVICTIHQPSAQLFLNFFDNLLLLGSGGYTLFFGRLGLRARNMIDYFNAIQGFEEFPQKINPAEHLVDQMSAQLPLTLESTAEKMYNSYYNLTCTDDQSDSEDCDIDGGDETNITVNRNRPTSPPVQANPTKIPLWCSLSSRQQFTRYFYLKYVSSTLREKADEFLALALAEGNSNRQSQLISHSTESSSPANSSPVQSINNTGYQHTLITVQEQPDNTTINQPPVSSVPVFINDSSSTYTTALSNITDPSSLQTLVVSTTVVGPHSDQLSTTFSPQPFTRAIPHSGGPHPGFRQQPNQSLVTGRHHDLHRDVGLETQNDPSNSDLLTAQKSPFWYQLIYVVQRQWHLYTRFSEYFWTRLISSVLTNIAFGLLYLNLELKSSGTFTTFLSATIFTSSVFAYLISTTALPIYNYLTRTVFYREQFCNYYRAWLWPVALISCELVWIMPVSIMSYIPLYFMIGSTNFDFTSFIASWLIAYASAVIFSQYALLLSLTLPEFTTEVTLNVTASIFFALQGIGTPKHLTNKLFGFFMSLNPFYYTNRAITVIQFRSRDTLISVYEGGQTMMVPVREWVESYTRFHYDSFWWSVLWLAVTLVTFFSIAIMSSIFLRWKS